MPLLKRANRFLNATIRVRTILLAMGLVLAGAFLLGLWKFEFIHEQVRAYLLGRTEILAEKFGYGLSLQEIDRVELSKVSDTGEATERVSVEAAGSRATFSAAAAEILEGKAAEEFVEQWSNMRFGWGYSAMCHDPAFLIKFMRGDKVLLATSVCFKCSNFTVPNFTGESLMGFDASDANAVAFANNLKSHFPESKKGNNLGEDE